MQQQAQGNFTPEQLIVAGRRAEAQGQPAYAMQFYRYIAEAYPQVAEAYEARDALYRLSQPAVAEPNGGTGYPSAPEHEGHPAHATTAAPGPGHVMPAPVMAAPVMAAPMIPGQDPRTAPTLEAGPGPSHGRPVGGRKAAARARRKAAEPLDEPPPTPAHGYRIGRLVAAMLGTMGWLMLLAALALGPLIAAALTVKSLPKGVREAIAGNVLTAGGLTFGLLFLGLFAIFAAQAARATFDTADAVRHLLAGNQQGQP